MNSRERVIRAIKFQKPDRAPVSHAVLPAAQLKYGQALNEILTEYREDFGWDYMSDLPIERFPALYKQGFNYDDFGTGCRGGSTAATWSASMTVGTHVGHGLLTSSSFNNCAAWKTS
jgi:hypothetical protein